MCALVVALLPVGDAEAVTRSVTVTSRSSSWGIVANNKVWGGRAITWSVSLRSIPSADRVRTQAWVGGRWRTVTTTIRSRTSTTARGYFYPLFGRRYYRVVAVTSTGGVVAASRSFLATGFATVPLGRVVDVAPAPATGTLTTRGLTFPALWHTATTSIQPPYGTPSATIAPGRCRSYVMATAVTYNGNAGEVGRASITAGYKDATALTWYSGRMIAEATSPDGQQPAGVTATALLLPDPAYSVSLWFSAWATNPFTTPFVSGEAWGGGVGLCSRTAR